MTGSVDLSFVLANAWLIPAIPFFSFLLVGLFIRPFSERLSGFIATGAVAVSAILAGILAWDYVSFFGRASDGYPAFVSWSAEWLRYQEGLVVNVGTLIDPISVMLLVVVTLVSTMVHLYSIGYMHGERGYGRYFAFLNFFTFSMLGLVLAPNILQMYVFWELVGASSFFLIGFYFERPSAVAASKKAFIVTRFADLGFLLGVLILAYFGQHFFTEVSAGAAEQPFDFLYLTRPEVLGKLASVGSGFFGVGLLTFAMVLVYMGAAGKSAMFPLHIWLPDAMEGPTPVSALIHAATMVVAGVYLVARMFPVFAATSGGLNVVAYVGAFTCLFAAVIGCVQDDIKRVLAFSTLSQLGYMMLALGIASLENPAGYTASMFHLFTHAFFKALLFLAAGAMIHAVHDNEIWKMGGLAKKMPFTHATFLIGALALAGIWPFAGFFSKDEILAAALHGGRYGIFAIGVVAAGLTAFYMSRIYLIAFWGNARTDKASHAHEAPLVMLVPLFVLALLSIVGGFIPLDKIVNISSVGVQQHGHAGIDFMVAIPSTVIALLGILAAWGLYAKQSDTASMLADGFSGLYMTVKRKFYIDEVYLFVTRKIIFPYIAQPIAWFDRHVVDGGVNLSGWSARICGFGLSFLQTGQVQTYGVWLAGGAAGIGILVVTMLLWS
ncbi:MAG: NADH-quinone oxidoreductase subunit L [Bdellovibrionota bacterium]